MGISKECHYFSYKEELATYHIGDPKNEDNIKDLIARNPYFVDVIDSKKDAETMAVYFWPHNPRARVSLVSHGVLSFSRGVHTKGIVFIDDPLKDEDPSRKMDATSVKAVNYRIKANIASMPQYEVGGELHIVGTPQTEEDFYYDEGFVSESATRYDAAILNWEKKKVLFPEFRPWDWLISKYNQLGKKIFYQEYQGQPAHSLDSFLPKEDYRDRVNTELVNYAVDLKQPFRRGTRDLVIAGFDIGKKKHPSHLAVLRVTYRDSGGMKIKQIGSKWYENWDYGKQLADLIFLGEEHLMIDALWYDNTRGEFEALEEAGKIPSWMKPVNLQSTRTRTGLSTYLSNHVEDSKDIEFLDDKRQERQTLLVDNLLQARETKEGHGDSFWSLCLAMNFEIETIYSRHFSSDRDFDDIVGDDEGLTAGFLNKEW